MAGSSQVQTVQLLRQWRDGDEASGDALIRLFYPWLEETAGAMLSGDRQVSLCSGDLVHEAIVRLIKLERIDWQDRAHFKALSSKLMRRVLVDHMRFKRAAKRDHQRVTLVTNVEAHPRQELQSLNHALLRLAAIDRGKAEIVEMRYFGGMSIADIAIVTGLSEPTVKRRWTVARAWLTDALESSQ